jgi:hypothetical protein
MSEDYSKWVDQGHSKSDAWKMTCVCVWRIFEEIHSKCVIAHDTYDLNDPEFSGVLNFYGQLGRLTVSWTTM